MINVASVEIATAVAEKIAELQSSGKDHIKWFKAHGISRVDIHDCINRKKSFSDERENKMRTALGMDLINLTHVALRDNEMVIRKPGHGKHHGRTKRVKQRAVRYTPEEADVIDEIVDSFGYNSYSEMMLAELPPEALVEAILHARMMRNGGRV